MYSGDCFLVADSIIGYLGRGPTADTIESALTQPDKTVVRLRAVQVEKIWTFWEPYYFTVRAREGKEDYRLIILTKPPAMLTHNMTVDIEGVLCTTPDGYRALKDCTISGYFNSRGELDPSGPPPLPEGMENLYFDKRVISETTTLVQTSSFDNRAYLADGGGGPPGPSPEPGPEPYVCDTIADARLAYDNYYNPETNPQVMVRIECKGVSDPQSGGFTMTEPTDSIAVFVNTNATPVLATDRVNKVIGTILKEGSNYWIDVDSGNGWNVGFAPGSLQVAHSGTIAWAKTFPDGTVLPTDGRDYAVKVVCAERLGIANGGNANYYMLDTDGASGILVTVNGAYGDMGSGGIYEINGTLDSRLVYSGVDGPERVILSGSELWAVDSQEVRPRFVQTKSLFCASFNKYSPGFQRWDPVSGNFVNGVGLNMVGQLVKIAGKVTTSVYDYWNGCTAIYVDDGSGMMDGTVDSYNQKCVGVRVVTPIADYVCPESECPDNPDFVAITGIVSAFYDEYQQIGGPLIRGSETTWESISDYAVVPPRKLYANPENAKVTLTWEPAPNALSYRIIRWESADLGETWSWPIDLVETTGNTYVDTNVVNEMLYAYNICSVGLRYAGYWWYDYYSPYPAFAYPSDWYSSIAINSITTNADDDGWVAINYTYTPGAGPASGVVTLEVDDMIVQSCSTIGDSYMLYDTTNLTNGDHKFKLCVSPPTELDYIQTSSDEVTFTVNNWVEKFIVPNLTMSLDGHATATFKGPSVWQFEVYQNGTEIDTISGEGDSGLAVSWDNSGAGEGRTDVRLTATDTATNKTRKIYRHSYHTQDYGDPIVPMWCIQGLYGDEDYGDWAYFQGIRNHAYNRLKTTSRYTDTSTQVPGASHCLDWWSSHSDMLNSADYSLRYFAKTPQNDMVIDIWNIVGYCMDPYLGRRQADVEIIWGDTYGASTRFGFFGGIYPNTTGAGDIVIKDQSGNPTGDMYRNLDYLLGLQNPVLSYDWQEPLKGCITGDVAVAGAWSLDDTKIGWPGIPPEGLPPTRPGASIKTYNQLRITVFSAIGSGNNFRFPLVFGVNPAYVFHIPYKSRRYQPRQPGIHRVDIQPIDHVFVGFESDGNYEGLEFFSNKFWQYMREGRTVWGAAKMAYYETIAAIAYKNPPGVIIFGDPWTKLTPSTVQTTWF